MAALASISDSDLLARLPSLVRAELTATADVIEYLMEVDRRRLYLDQACSSLYAFLTERLGYTEDEAGTRVRVTRLALRFPQVLLELRSGAIHLTGLFALSNHLTQQNVETLLAHARGKSRRELARLLAGWFPKPDVPDRITGLLNLEPSSASTDSVSADNASTEQTPQFTWADPGNSDDRPRLEPLSATRYRIEFTASAELRDKIERARQLVSHALPSGDLALLFERALDELIRREAGRRTGAGGASGVTKPRKRRQLKPGSRHIPVHVAQLVWERDGHQCTFVDDEGRRCSARRYLTIEHRRPFALGGPAEPDNLCLLCLSHNLHTARRVFGETPITKKRARRAGGSEPASSEPASSEPASSDNDRRAPALTSQCPDIYDKVRCALLKLGFRQREAGRAIAELKQSGIEARVEPLLRAACQLLTCPAA